MGYSLDFSGWKSGNSALANAQSNAATTRAKAKASQASGLTAGLGTVIGAIFGGPMGAMIGRSIGGGDMAGAAEAVASDMPTTWDTLSREAETKKKTPFNEKTSNGDLMQLASAYNMIDENGNIKPTFLQLLQDINK